NATLTASPSSAVSSTHGKGRPTSRWIERWPASEPSALTIAKITTGIAIILIRLTQTVPSGPNQVCAAGPISQPASAPSTKPAATRCQNGILSQRWARDIWICGKRRLAASAPPYPTGRAGATRRRERHAAMGGTAGAGGNDRSHGPDLAPRHNGRLRVGTASAAVQRRTRERCRPLRPLPCLTGPAMPRLLPVVPALLTTLLAACAATPQRATAPTSWIVDVPVVEHPDGESPQWWYRSGAARAAANGAMAGRAKNVIVFLGDGMSLTTVAAARVLEGQRGGGPGEENLLAWERFPHTAFSKTYNTDSQTPDSAGTMTAIAAGVKSHMGAIGVASGAREDCAGSLDRRLVSWLQLADDAGLATGIVST